MTHSFPPASRRRGFTMMEIMVTVAIIAILVALTVLIGRTVRNNSLMGATKATLSTLQGEMSRYIKDNPEPSGNPADWLVKLTVDPKAAGEITHQKWYVGGQALDAWGNAIVYLPSKTGGANPPVVPAGWAAKDQGYFWSYGPDGQPGGNDDLFSDGVAP